ncbi:hypothetical protein E2C01_063744 [Portunus trituberculatus]|uniref:Uncharacterized protein n=1 Tax=Portunus trituberculatus TaxID=210409 RepID=A0A5B7HLD0_PORTR|nr:hypothetical protein [Portunus trituberculatus]
MSLPLPIRGHHHRHHADFPVLASASLTHLPMIAWHSPSSAAVNCGIADRCFNSAISHSLATSVLQTTLVSSAPVTLEKYEAASWAAFWIWVTKVKVLAAAMHPLSGKAKMGVHCMSSFE